MRKLAAALILLSVGIGAAAENKGKGKGPAKQLYNLKDDPGEQHNLAAQYPERVKSLENKLASVIAASRSRE